MMRQHEEIRVQILATSDIHSHILNGEEGAQIYRAGTYVSEIRQREDHVLLLDNGGSLAGNIVAFYYAIIAPHKRHPMIKLMNALDYNASGVSADEFKFGLDFLNRSVALSRFPWLSANIEYAMTHEPYFSTPYFIHKIDDLRIAVIGLTSESLVKNENIEMEKDIAIERATISAKRWIRYIYEAEAPDFLIVLYHGGVSTSQRTEKEVADQYAHEILKNIGIVDLFITGHQRATTLEHEDGTLFVRAGQNGEHLVHVEITFRRRQSSYETLKIEPTIVTLSDYEEHPELLEMTRYDRKAVQKWKNEGIHGAKVDTCFFDFQELLLKPHPFIELLHESMGLHHQVNISCVHLPLPLSKGLKSPIQHKDVYDAYPHPDQLIEVTLRGQVIKTLIEKSVAYLQEEAGTLKLSQLDPTRFLFWKGFDYTIDMSQPVHQRVTQMSLRQDYTYRVTMTDYCYRHYRQYLKDAPIHEVSKQSMPELMIERLSSSEPIKEAQQNMYIVGY